METIKTTSKQKNILFVDNDNDIIQEIKESSNADKNIGLNIIFAKNAKEALKKISEQKIDLAIVEILLPVINGYHLISKLIKENISTIIYTKLKESQDIAKMATTGVDNIFIKELTKSNDLIDRISKEDSLKTDLNKVSSDIQNKIKTTTGDEIQSKIKMVQCPRCNSVLVHNSHFCNNCGQKILVNTKKVEEQSLY